MLAKITKIRRILWAAGLFSRIEFTGPRSLERRRVLNPGTFGRTISLGVKRRNRSIGWAVVVGRSRVAVGDDVEISDEKF